jgi:hypothetical protein
MKPVFPGGEGAILRTIILSVLALKKFFTCSKIKLFTIL